MENVVVLAPDEAARIDAVVLSDLVFQMGEAGAEGVISRAVEEVMTRLTLIERLFFQADIEELWKAARGLVGIAKQVGMTGLADIAGAVAECCEQGDPVALGAVMDRLARSGDRSLTALWDLPFTSACEP